MIEMVLSGLTIVVPQSQSAMKVVNFLSVERLQ
jgi:hypothetical protein